MNLSEEYQNSVNNAIGLLEKSRNILCISGAGISAESGLPTYRGIGGLYENKHTEDRMPIEEALSGTMMQINPEITWRYLAQIESACRNARYNRAHEIIAMLERHFERVCVLTQNVDGFHQQAGSKNVIEIHGNLKKLYCQGCGFIIADADYGILEVPPQCPTCFQVMRPDVVLFGEFLAEENLEVLSRELQLGFDAIMIVGTSGVFPYIISPIVEASQKGIPMIEINPEHTVVSRFVTIKFAAGAVKVLSDIWEGLRKSFGK